MANLKSMSIESLVLYFRIMRTLFVYIMSNKKNGTLYTGVTNDLLRRVYEHKHKINEGFSSSYDLNKLVYFEEVEGSEAAIWREKNIKAWKRGWKKKLIEDMNPNWRDLYFDIGGKEFDKEFDLEELKERYKKA